MRLFKGKSLNPSGILQFVLLTVVVLVLLGRLIIPVFAPLFSGGDINLTPIENIEPKFWFTLLAVTIAGLLVIKFFVREKITTRTLGVVLILGIGIYLLVTETNILDFLKTSLATAQTIILP